MIRNLVVRGRIGFAAGDIKYLFTRGVGIGEGATVVAGPYVIAHRSAYVAGQRLSDIFVAGQKQAGAFTAGSRQQGAEG